MPGKKVRLAVVLNGSFSDHGLVSVLKLQSDAIHVCKVAGGGFCDFVALGFPGYYRCPDDKLCASR